MRDLDFFPRHDFPNVVCGHIDMFRPLVNLRVFGKIDTRTIIFANKYDMFVAPNVFGTAYIH
jgi:hypothetical protein